uniref:Uncharacterized protein n=1 Tax=Pyrodinium bahamense TaxID=73915 RepID=A0A7S0FIN6_9DINO|mmetsp:Transcript_33186/g.91774  ORF Transcript_33186/g.91774 Transcript_33186/m.91774 type:complete len:329 (+) Transcript_33186:61-1047(+)
MTRSGSDPTAHRQQQVNITTTATLVAGALVFGLALGSVGSSMLSTSFHSIGSMVAFGQGRFLARDYSPTDAAPAAVFDAEQGPLQVRKSEPPPGVCVVVGVGPGIGEHVARRFAAGGCRVALLARTAEKVARIAKAIPRAKAYACDATDASQVASTFAAIRSDLGAVDALIYNVGGGAFVSFENLTLATLDTNLKSGAMGFFLTAREVSPGMVARGHGAIGVTGATSAWRGLSSTAGFAPGKFASRALAQSLARDLGPRGVHVFHVVVDGAVNMTDGQSKHSSLPDNYWMQPEDIAETYYELAIQPRSAWTFELSVTAWGAFGSLASI